jgi:lantibiotic leader peptide-processing serine protease
MMKISVAVGALALLGTAAHAATYVLSAPAEWGAAQASAVAAAGGGVKFAHAQSGIAVVESASADFLSKVRKGGAISTAALDVVRQWQRPLASEDIAAVPASIAPANDTLYGFQWAPAAIQAPQAWALGYTGRGVRVAVIDGGIYANHIDLAANMDNAASRSFVAPDPAQTPAQNACRTAYNCDTGTFWHGTHVAGIIAAVDNATGVVGIAPEATIVGVKALHSGSGSFAAVIQSLLYASTDGRADIINMSLGAEFNRNEEGAAELVSALNKAVNFATRNGSLVVVSAGNDALNMDRQGNLIVTPAESGNAIAISSTAPLTWAYGATNYARPSSYSNYGNSLVWVSAPGGDFAYEGNENCTVATPNLTLTRPCWVFDMVLSTVRGTTAAGAYSWTAGTSMSAPAASAVAALIKQKNPAAGPAQLKTKLAQSATDEGKNGQDSFHGRGFVNALNAVTQ